MWIFFNPLLGRSYIVILYEQIYMLLSFVIFIPRNLEECDY